MLDGDCRLRIKDGSGDHPRQQAKLREIADRPVAYKVDQR
jgi:hypothetical protein